MLVSECKQQMAERKQCVSERGRKKVWHSTMLKAGPRKAAQVSLLREVTIEYDRSYLCCDRRQDTCQKINSTAALHCCLGVLGRRRKGGRSGVGDGGGGGGPLVSECVTWKQKHRDTGYRFGELQIERPVQHITEACVHKMHPAVSFMSAYTITFTVILPVFALSFINVPVGASTHFATFIFEQIFYSLSLRRQLCFEVVIHFNP